MRYFGIISFLFFLTLLHAGCKDKREPKGIEISKKDIKFKKLKVGSILDIVDIKKVIITENSKNSVFGTVDSVEWSKNGDIFIGDYFTTKRVLRFNSRGDYIDSYGQIGEAPGEYTGYIRGFGLLEDGIVLLSSHKLIKLSFENKLIVEKKIDFRGYNLKIIDKKIFIGIDNYMRDEKEYSYLILDENLKEVGGVGNYDLRLQRYRYLPFNGVSTNGELICFVDLYSLGYTIFDPDGSMVQRFFEPYKDNEFKNIWLKRRLTELDRDQIKLKKNTFSNIQFYNDTIFGFQVNRENKTYLLWVLNYKIKEAFLIDNMNLNSKQLHMDECIGTCKKGFISTFDNYESFNKYKSRYPVLKDIDYEPEDNPILVIFDFKKSIQ